MNKSKFLATLLSGGVVLSAMAGFGGMVLADDEVDTTAPTYQVTFSNRTATGVRITFTASDESGIASTTATVYKTSEGPEQYEQSTSESASFGSNFILDGSGEEYTVITTATDNNGNTTVKKYAYDPMLGNGSNMVIYDHLDYSRYVIDNDHLYIRYDVSSAWHSAEEYCRRLGGHLVSIGSEEEYNVVYDLIKVTDGTNRLSNYYIGFTDENDEGNWYWTDGTEVSFTNWSGGEPNGGKGENWTHVYTNNGRWNDTHISMGFGFVAEIDLSAMKKDTFTNEFDFDNYEDNKFYSEYTFWSPSSWDVAQIILNNNEDLKCIKIESEEENAYLVKTLADAGIGAAYIGISENADTAGAYQWLDGTEANFTNFATADTKGYTNTVICNSEDGKWHREEGLAEGQYGKIGFITENELPTPTVTPTPEPTATATPEPTATTAPTATATPKPTATTAPTATATPKVTATTAPTATPVATTEPTVAPTEAAEPTAVPTEVTEPTVAPTAQVTNTPADESKAQIMDFVKRIYIYVLDRDPEEEGAAFWSNELWEFKRSGAEVAQGFIFSEEFENRKTTDDQFVEILYKTFFGRDSEAEGKAFWLEQLKNGTMDRVAVANGFIFSQEWADTCASYGIRSGGDIKPSGVIAPTELTYGFVERMYTTAMNRTYDEEGRQYWASELANFNITGEQVGALFFLSDEMVSYNLSDDDYVERLYKTFMDRDSEAEGKAYWIGFLKEGHTREEVVYGFTRSPEFTAKCVEARILPFL